MSPQPEPVDELDKLRARNQAHLQQLSADGVQVNLIPGLIDELIAHVFIDDDEKRTFQLAWERKASAMLTEIDRDVRMAKLSAGMHRVNGHR